MECRATTTTTTLSTRVSTRNTRTSVERAGPTAAQTQRRPTVPAPPPAPPQPQVNQPPLAASAPEPTPLPPASHSLPPDVQRAMDQAARETAAQSFQHHFGFAMPTAPSQRTGSPCSSTASYPTTSVSQSHAASQAQTEIMEVKLAAAEEGKVQMKTAHIWTS